MGRFVKRSNGEYYLERKTTRRGNNKSYDEDCNYRDWWLIKYAECSLGVIPLRSAYIPKELIGKRVRIKLEILK